MVSVTAIAAKESAVEKITSTEGFKSLIKEDLIFKTIEGKSGSKLYLINPQGVFDPSEYKNVPEEDYIRIDVDRNDDLDISGIWYDYPFDLDIVCQMSFVIDDLSEDRIKQLIDDYDYSFFQTERATELHKIVANADYDEVKLEHEILEEIEPVLDKYYTDLQSLFTVSDQKFFYDVKLDTSESQDSTFIGTFSPNLQLLIKWKDTIAAEEEDLNFGFGDNFASSTFYLNNYELLEEVSERLEIDLSTLRNFPGIQAEKYNANPEEGWF